MIAWLMGPRAEPRRRSRPPNRLRLVLLLLLAGVAGVLAILVLEFGTFRSMFEGNTAVLIDKFDADTVWDLVERERINVISVTGDAMARPLIVDGRNLLDPVAARDAGFVYEGIGRPKHASPAEPELRDPELQL